MKDVDVSAAKTKLETDVRKLRLKKNGEFRQSKLNGN